MDKLDKYLAIIARRQDLVIVAFILLVTALMILPLPTWLMDLMIAVNITIGMLFLLLAVYLKSPLEFSTLPSAILIATLVRIAITISTSRLILIQADAGSIIASFGEFVIAGNVVVGLVIFAIIAIAQFVVITKGAERVAEVAARFALDALPGKQMSIDSDLRAGDIDRHEARRRRLNLERESQYYGAMDGAMKFVKGDAIVSMIIIFVNLVGGLIVGTMVRGLDVGTAFSTYALLTVGDGLSAQLPALLVAVAGGIVVTRVTTENSENLGTDLARELVSSAQSLAIVAAALFALALVPGFPTLTFLGLATLTAGGAAAIYVLKKRETRKVEAEQRDTAAAREHQVSTRGPSPSQPGETFTVRVSPSLAERLDGPVYRRALDEALARASRQQGIRLLTPGYRADVRLPEGAVAFDVDGAPAWQGSLRTGLVFSAADPQMAALEGIADAAGDDLPGLGRGVWIESAAAERLAAKGLARYDLDAALAAIASALVTRWSARSFGLQEADQWLNDLAAQGLGALVQQTRNAVSLTRLAETLRHLLSEGVGLAHPRIVLEALVDLAPKVDDNMMLADHVRLSLSRPISAAFADTSRMIAAVVVELDIEEMLRQSMREGPAGVRISLDHRTAEQVIGAIRRRFSAAGRDGAPLVLMTGFDIRRAVRQFVSSRTLDIPVLAFEEVATGYEVLPISSLNMASLNEAPQASEAKSQPRAASSGGRRPASASELEADMTM